VLGFQLAALLRKRAAYGLRDRRLLVCQLILPVGLVAFGLALLLLRPDLNQPSLALSPSRYNTHLPAHQRNFVPIIVDKGSGPSTDSIHHRPYYGSALEQDTSSSSTYFADSMAKRFDGVHIEAVGVSVPTHTSSSSSLLADPFAGCSQGASVLHNMSAFLINTQRHQPYHSDDGSDVAVAVDERGASRYGAVTIAAAETDETKLAYNVMVNGSARHAPGIFVNLVHQAYLQVTEQ
jgi:hypothetical protein